MTFLTLIALGISNNLLTKYSGSYNNDSPSSGFPAGHLPLSHFSFEDMSHLQVWSMAQNSDNIMIFATPRGIISFDGQQEKFTPIPAIPYTLRKNPHNNQIYAACAHGFGIIKNDLSGNYTYKALNKPENDYAYTDIVFINDETYFIGDESVTILDSVNRQVLNVLAEDTLFNSWFTHKSKLYIRKADIFYDIKDNNKTLPQLSEKLIDQKIKAFTNEGDTAVLITNKNKFYKYAGFDLSEFKVESQKYFDESTVTGGCKIDNQKYAVSTLNGGVLIINIKTGKTLYTVNYRTGLPDDEVFASGTDNSGGFWISHEYGLSRADLSIPIRDYTNYPGLEGKINDLYIADTVLYAATGKGLYYLSEITDFDEIQILIEKSELQKQCNVNLTGTYHTTAQKTQDDTEDNWLQQVDDSDKEDNLLERWKKKRRKKKNKKKKNIFDEDNENETVSDNTKTNHTSETKPTPVNQTTYKPVQRRTYTKKKVKKTGTRKTYELQSVSHAYKKVDGLDSKCSQILQSENGLFIVSNAGLYKVENFKAEQILKGQVNQIAENQNVIFIVTKDKIYTYKDDILNPLNLITDDTEINFKSVLPTNHKIWIGGLNTAYSINTQDINNDNISTKSYKINSEFPEKIIVKQIDDIIYFFTTDAVYEYNPLSDEIKINNEYSEILNYKSNIYFPMKNSFIIKEKGKITKTAGIESYKNQLKYLFFNSKQHLIRIQNNAVWTVNTANKLLKISAQNTVPKSNISLRITKITSSDSTSYNTDTSKIIQLDYNYGRLNISLSAPSYLKQKSVHIFYGLDDETDYNEVINNSLSLPTFSYGEHEIKLYAQNLLNEKSDVLTIKVNVKTPIWHSTIFWIIVSLLGLALGSITAMLINRQKNIRMQRRNEELEAEVQRRTQKIQEQSAEIQAQNEEILARNKHIEEQNKQIKHQNKEITDSIKYASRIQNAVLPSRDYLTDLVGEHFIYFKPRDIVSGDFYWFHKIENEIFIAAADCTGHGVPGGFLSMLGISFLNEIVTERNITAGEILDRLRLKVIKSLNQNSDTQSRDGMDIALIKVNTDTLKMEFAGANNLIYLLRGENFDQIKADRMPVGLHRMQDKPFTTNTVQLQRNDLIYLFSDGFVDQFSEKTKRKFSKARLRELLIQIKDLDMKTQYEIIEAMFLKWKGNYIQVDDILLIGLKV